MSRDPRKRAIEAAARILRVHGSVDLFGVFAEMGWLQASHYRRWEKGEIDDLFSLIASTPERRVQVVDAFLRWAQESQLKGIEAPRMVRCRDGVRALKVMADGPSEAQAAFNTQFVPADTPARKQESIKKKAQKPADLVAYIKRGRNDTQCAECGKEIHRRDIFFTEDKQALCLTCADLDHLEFLPSGNAALSRRARKYSPLNAVVVEWSRRKRYERRGILVQPEAIRKAEDECLADADLREARRLRSQKRRAAEDKAYRLAMVEKILELFPACPRDEAATIAAHTTVRGSDRVGRTAAAKDFDPGAIQHAVVAHIRHRRTRYDLMLMGGTPRQVARERIQAELEKVLLEWRGITG